MTRETKVGLLVGMGVILLIGIIISDHLSVVQQQNPAELTDFASRAQESINPLVRPEPESASPTSSAALQPPVRESVLQRMQPVPTPSELQAPPWRPVPDESSSSSPMAELPRAYSLSNGGTAEERPYERETVEDSVPTLTLSRQGARGLFESPPPRAVPGQTLAMGPAPTPSMPASSLFTPPADRGPTRDTPTAAELAPPPAPSTGEIIHYVAPNESLYQIAKKYYGNGDYWRVIAEHNRGRVRDNGQVNQGVRLVIPNRAGLAALGPDFIPVPREGVRPVPVQPADASTAGKTIEVQSGDTLTKLASKHLGSADRWKELWDANRDQLAKPESLRVGMKLVLPGARRAAANVQPIVPRPQPQVRATSPQGQRQQPSRTGGKDAYVVQSGDNLSYIAEVTLGSRDRWREIYDANKDHLSSPDALVVGQKLRIP